MKLLEDIFILLLSMIAIMGSFFDIEFLAGIMIPPFLLIGLLNFLADKEERGLYILSGVLPLGIATIMGGIGSFLLILWAFFYVITMIIFDL